MWIQALLLHVGPPSLPCVPRPAKRMVTKTKRSLKCTLLVLLDAAFDMHCSTFCRVMECGMQLVPLTHCCGSMCHFQRIEETVYSIAVDSTVPQGHAHRGNPHPHKLIVSTISELSIDSNTPIQTNLCRSQAPSQPI